MSAWSVLDPEAEIRRAERIIDSKRSHFQWSSENVRYEMFSERPCPMCDSIGITLILTVPWDNGRGRAYGFTCTCGAFTVPGDQFERLLNRIDIQ